MKFAALFLFPISAFAAEPLEVHVRLDPYDPVHQVWERRLEWEQKIFHLENIHIHHHEGPLAYKVASKYSKDWRHLPADAIPEVMFWRRFQDFLHHEYWREEELAEWSRRMEQRQADFNQAFYTRIVEREYPKAEILIFDSSQYWINFEVDGEWKCWEKDTIPVPPAVAWDRPPRMPDDPREFLLIWK